MVESSLSCGDFLVLIWGRSIPIIGIVSSYPTTTTLLTLLLRCAPPFPTLHSLKSMGLSLIASYNISFLLFSFFSSTSFLLFLLITLLWSTSCKISFSVSCFFCLTNSSSHSMFSISLSASKLSCLLKFLSFSFYFIYCKNAQLVRTL